jgi:prolyl-tRNA synthetase
VPIADAARVISKELSQMQSDLLERAREMRRKHSFVVDDYEDFKRKLEDPGGFLHCHWCERGSCEAQIKEETKATIRCIPLDAADRLTPAMEQGRCIKCGGNSTTRVIFARNY